MMAKKDTRDLYRVEWWKESGENGEKRNETKNETLNAMCWVHVCTSFREQA